MAAAHRPCASGAMNVLVPVLAALALASCATLPRLAAPQVVDAQVRVVALRLPEVRLGVDLGVRNPNARAVDIEALEATLAVGGDDAGRATLVRPVTLPAEGEARVTLDVRADASVALARVGAALGAGRPLDAEVRGTLRLADGTTWPFRRRVGAPAPGRAP